MPDTLIGWFSSVPPEVATFLIAALPFGELRAALPIALLKFDLPLLPAVFFSIAGNLLPMVLVWGFLQWGEKIARRTNVGSRFLDWLFERTHRKFADSHAKYGAFALAIFVAIPLPMTGVWTGSIAAWLFAVPKVYAVPAITAGVIVAAGLVLAVTLGGISLVSLWDRS